MHILHALGLAHSNPDNGRNTAGKWSKATIRSILTNPVYTGRLFWNRLDFRQAKVGEGPVIRRAEEEWIEAGMRHDALRWWLPPA